MSKEYIEQFLQTALEFSKEIWSQLNPLLGIENSAAFKIIQPYLVKLQENPLYSGLALSAFFLLPLLLIKAKSSSKKRERTLDELMEEIEEDGIYAG